MAYDELRGQTVLFGGGLFNGGPGSDLSTWGWDGNAWSVLSANGPSWREASAMAYDSQRGRVVLSGGVTSVLVYSYPYPVYAWPPATDTWEWDGTSWTRVDNNSPGRIGLKMAYDSQRGRVVSFGGHDGANSMGTYEWYQGAWSLVSTAGPVSRDYHCMVFDGQLGRCVVFGGSAINDTWEWDGSNWVQFTGGPVARYGAAMVYDSRRGCVVLNGGFDYASSTYLNDTWERTGRNWVATGLTGPSGRHYHAMAFDTLHACTVLFGGSQDFTGTSVLGDTWTEIGALPGAAAVFGVGCGAPQLSLAPAAGARPVLGATAQASLANLTSSTAFVALGWSNASLGATSLPLALDSLGMPGCLLLQSTDFSALSVALTGPTTATFSLPLPALPGLLGLHVYLQAWAYAPAANAAQVIVSNGVAWSIGNS